MSQNREKYTKPELREQIKEEIKASDQGGKPGQWSARKSQLLVQEYEKRGGGYTTDQKDESAKSLEEWTEQNWQTQEGEGQARQDGKTKRYLPQAVWERLSEEEKREAEESKKQASQKGQQYVEWTPAIKRAMEAVGYGSEEEDTGEATKQELYDQAQELEIEGRSQMDKAELRKAITQKKQDVLSDQTRDELYAQAQDMGIEGRSQMNKAELREAIAQKIEVNLQ
jgi:hypothetical protein